LEELKAIKPENNTRWLLLGDFNLIYKAADKNNRRLHHRLMQQFREVLSECELHEIHLQNHKFTWNNERHQPTLIRLDRVFCNAVGTLLLARIFSTPSLPLYQTMLYFYSLIKVDCDGQGHFDLKFLGQNSKLRGCGAMGMDRKIKSS
jgi:hypothetical protein